MGRGFGRPLLLLGLTEDVSAELGVPSVEDDVGDVGDSRRFVGETGGVLLLVVEESSSVRRSASRTCCSDVSSWLSRSGSGLEHIHWKGTQWTSTIMKPKQTNLSVFPRPRP